MALKAPAMKGLPLLGPRNYRPTIYWYVSLRCNLACKHCWVESSPNVDTSTDLSNEDMVAAVDNMATLNPAGVILTGGEPLLRPGIDQVISALADNDIPIFIETNAMLVTDKLLSLANDIAAAGKKIHFSVSVDGGTVESHDWCRGKGSFTSTVDGMRRLREADHLVDIQCVVNRRNWQSLGQLAELARELEVVYLKFVLSSPVGRATRFTRDLSIPFEDTNAALQVLADAIDDYPGKVLIKVPPAMIPPSLQDRFRGATATACGVQNVTSCSFPLLGVLPDGSVTICAATRESGDAFFGDIREVSLADIWQAESLDIHRERYLDAQLEGICADCVFKQECRGACRAYAFVETGSFEGPYPICAEMDRQGHFPEAYRLSRLDGLHGRLRELQSSGA